MTIASINEVISNVHSLPSLPTVVMQLLSCIDQEDAGTAMLSEKLSQDQALAAKTLRLANSSFYGMTRQVASIPQAIAILGLNNVRTLVAAAAITDAFPGPEKSRFDFERFWRSSIATALLAQALARRLRLDHNQAFIAGMLHDIGRLVLVVRYPEDYEQVLDYCSAHQCALLEAERATLHIEHTQIGRALAERWKFPESIRDAIDGGDAAADALTLVVQLASEASTLLIETSVNAEALQALAQPSLQQWEISADEFQQMLEQTALSLEETCRALVTRAD